MKKRLVAITAILTAIVGAIALILALLPARPGVTKANFDRLKKRMNLAEVESVFGRETHYIGHFANYSEHNWRGADGVAFVCFDQGGKIEEMGWHDLPISLRQKLQRRFPWLPD